MRLGDYEIQPYVVVIQEIPERTKFILSHFQERGIEARIFNGVSLSFGLRTIHPYERDAPGSKWNIGPKPTATWLSFYMLWSALNELPNEYFLTLEWDAKFPENWRERADRALRDVPPDFDMLYLGSCCASKGARRHIKGEVWDVRWPQCGHATIIAKKALPVILQSQRKVYAPLDISLLLHTLPMLRVYTVLPRIAEQFDTQLED